MAVLEDVGSDHLPIHAELCLTGTAAAHPAPKPASGEDRRDVGEILQEYREERGER